MNDRFKFRVWYLDIAKGFYYTTIEDSYAVLGKDAWSEPYVIQQYTGLKDKNNREIYVGDILFNEKWHSPSCVEFGLNHCFRSEDTEGYWHYNISNGFLLRVIRHTPDRIYNFEFDEDEVDKKKMQLLETKIIGNIFENPELLKYE